MCTTPNDATTFKITRQRMSKPSRSNKIPFHYPFSVHHIQYTYKYSNVFIPKKHLHFSVHCHHTHIIHATRIHTFMCVILFTRIEKVKVAGTVCECGMSSCMFISIPRSVPYRVYICIYDIRYTSIIECMCNANEYEHEH